MSRKIKSKEPSIFRLMYISVDCKNNNHVDFQTKEEALDYANNLSSLLIEWYGIYELSPKVDYLISIEHKRLIPHDDKIIVKPKDDGVQQKLHKQRQKKK